MTDLHKGDVEQGDVEQGDVEQGDVEQGELVHSDLDREDLEQGAQNDDARQRARKRLERKRDFKAHVVAYVVINTAFVLVWLFTGRGYFWPAWILAGWGIALVLDCWDVYFRLPITDEDVDRELRSGS